MGFHSRGDWRLCLARVSSIVSGRWKVLDETSPSGKRLFGCDDCGRVSTTPDKFCPPPCPTENKASREEAMRKLKDLGGRIGRGA